MRGNVRGLLALLVTAVIVVGGCEFQMRRPAAVYELTHTGVVESADEIEAGGLRVQLERGATVDLGVDGYAVSLHGGKLPEPGDLLLVARFGSTTGFAILRTGAGCHYLSVPAADDGSHILFESGLRLPKADGFDPGPIDDGQFPSHREGFCIGIDGEVLRYGS